MSLTSFLHDLCYASRVYRRRSGLAAAALLVLAVGIGGFTVIFSVVDTVLLRPLDYPQPERLVRLREHNLARGIRGMSSSAANFVDYWRHASSFSHVGAFRDETVALVIDDEAERVKAGLVSGDFFQVLGVPAALGATFSTEPGVPDDRGVVVLSHTLWNRAFGAHPRVVGTTLELDGETYTVLGVMPESFDFPESTELWYPLRFDGDQWAGRHGRYLRVIARLAPGVTLTRAQQEMDLLSDRLAREHAANEGWSTGVTSLEAEVTERIRPAMSVLLAGSVFLLVVSCVNVTNLLLASVASRTDEMATRAALGADAGRLIRQLLTESVALTALGGVCGLALARFANRVLVRSVPELAPRWSEIQIGGRVALVAVAIALLSGVAVGTVPAIRMAACALRARLSKAHVAASMSLRGPSLPRAFSAIQIGLSIVLIVGAGLLLRSFDQLTRVDPGFDPDNVVSVSIELPRSAYDENALRAAFYRQAVERLRALPGVESAGAVNSLPLVGSPTLMPFEIPGRPKTDRDFAPFYAVTPGYFETMRIPLRSGRFLVDGDEARSPSPVVLSETMARQFFGAEDPVGKIIDMDASEGTSHRTIVGVVGDVRHGGLDVDDGAAIYGLYQQASFDAMNLCLRTSSDPLALIPAAREALSEIDPHVPVGTIATMDEVLWDSTSQRRLVLVVTTAFAAITLVIALVGVYAVLSHTVTRATREIGVRLALGARRHHVRGLVNFYAASAIVPGLLVGLVAAHAASGLLASQLFGVGRLDVPTYLTAAALVASMALVACQAPAWRASRVDAATALRQE